MRHEKIDGFKIIGQLDAAVFDMSSPESQELELDILFHIGQRNNWGAARHQARYRELVARLRRLALVREYQVTNLVTTAGRSVLAQRLANTTTYTGIINYGAL